MINDQFGKRIYEGNRVVMSIGGQMMCGIVTKIDEGNVVLAGVNGTKARQGKMVVEFDWNLQWNPAMGDRLGGVILSMDQPEVCNADFETPRTKGESSTQ